MKLLTKKEFATAPENIKYIHTCTEMGFPISSAIYEVAMENHPEYFTEEIERARKWELIPQSVHDAYWKEIMAIDKELMKDVPHKGKGILKILHIMCCM